MTAFLCDHYMIKSTYYFVIIFGTSFLFTRTVLLLDYFEKMSLPSHVRYWNETKNIMGIVGEVINIINIELQKIQGQFMLHVTSLVTTHCSGRVISNADSMPKFCI